MSFVKEKELNNELYNNDINTDECTQIDKGHD